ncbi:c-type cytochrome [Paenalcaligenes sp. Me131]|uniref:c-type cytochrome n=1 Tax=Paenalcaligenes sp. Me131 TaxID=3392636 RepID=UPI003D293AD0
MKALILVLLGCVSVLGMKAAEAKRPLPTDGNTQLSYFLNSERVYKDYMLQCAGCHRYDGQGVESRGIPSFVDSIGLFSRMVDGRAYMIRVPGSAQSQLNNDELAMVLNYIVARFSPEEFERNGFRLFSAAEVGASRPYRFDDVAAARKTLEMQMEEKGWLPAPYLFGQAGR